jgi:hypothetical protein
MNHSGVVMNPFSPFGNPGFDPSKMDPKVLMELSQLVQQLPPEQLGRMQTMMHNAMAGFDVKREMEEFEKSLPPGFREKIVALMGGQGASTFGGGAASAPLSKAEQPPIEVASPLSDVREARMTVLRAVAHGQMSPEDAEQILFG